MAAQINRIFQNVIGFNAAERVLMTQHAFDSLEDLVIMDEKRITSMAEEMAKRTAAEGRVIIGMTRVTRLIGLMHWVQDTVLRCDDPIVPADVTREAINAALNNAKVRKVMRDNSDAQAKICNPGPFTDENKFIEF